MEPRYLGSEDTSWPEPDEGPLTDTRPGPVPVDDDSWNRDSAWTRVESWPSHVDDAARYRGRRRAQLVAARYRWWIGGAAAIVALAAAVALVVRSAPGADDTPLSSPLLPGRTTSGSPATAPSSEPPVSPSASPSPTPVGQGPFATITIEAEAGSPTIVLTGSAAVAGDDRASGGKIVTGLGDRGGAAPPGTLRFSGLTLPSAGTYRIAIHYTNDENHGTRSAVISVSGADAMTVNFPGGPKCCSVRTVDVSLAAGVHTITISNPSDLAPSVDKIVLSRS